MYGGRERGMDEREREREDGMEGEAPVSFASYSPCSVVLLYIVHNNNMLHTIYNYIYILYIVLST